MAKNKFNTRIFFPKIISLWIILSAMVCYSGNNKTPETRVEAFATQSEQDIVLAANKLFANNEIAEIKTMKHIWELAPFIGKNIQLYGQAVVYLGWKNDPVFFRVNGKLEIPAGLLEGWLKEQQVPLIREGDNLVSPLMVVRGKIVFDYLDMSISEHWERADDSTVPGGRWEFINLQVIKKYSSPPLEAERPADVLLAPPSESSKAQFNDIFYGLMGDADIITLTRYISMLDRKKAVKFESAQTGEANSVIDLIPFIGSNIELKGKAIKTGEYKNWLVINNKDKILIPIDLSVANMLDKTVIISGYLQYVYYTPANRHSLKENKFIPQEEGSLYLTSTKLVKVLAENELKENSLPCIREVENFVIYRARKSFITGFYQDADEISFRNFIINKMKKEIKKSDSKTK